MILMIYSINRYFRTRPFYVENTVYNFDSRITKTTEQFIFMGYRMQRNATFSESFITTTIDSMIKSTFPAQYLIGKTWRDYNFDLSGYENDLMARIAMGRYVDYKKDQEIHFLLDLLVNQPYVNSAMKMKIEATKNYMFYTFMRKLLTPESVTNIFGNFLIVTPEGSIDY